MSPDPRDFDDSDEQYGLEPPRSLFSALWFRVILVVVVIGVIAAVAVPFVLEWMNPPPPKSMMVKPDTPVAPAPTVQMPSAPATPPPAPAAPAPAKKEPSGAAALAPSAGAPTAPPVAARPPAPPAEDKPVAAPKSPAKAAAPRPAKAVAKAPAATGGAYFVQVGAFKDAEHAAKLASKLRVDKFRVAESAAGAGDEKSAASAPPAPAAPSAGGDKYDVFVTGVPADLTAKLSAKGLTAAVTPNGVVVTPSLPLREAVALSKDLAVDGLKVQVRRATPAGASAGPVREPVRPPASAGDGLHRVLVGPFADRAAATEALQALRGKGYRDAFIARSGA